MNNILFDVLNSVENMGYKAYIVGGFVRDFLWNINSHDVDICTNAPSDVIIRIFDDYNPKVFKYDSVKFKIDNYHFDISRIRKETIINGTTVIEFTDDIFDDYCRRDFTFNALYMNKSGHIMTFGNSYADCLNKRIVFINNSSDKINEDPSRLLRYIYFVLKYDLCYKPLPFDKKIFKKYIKDQTNKYIVDYYLNKIYKLDLKDRTTQIFNEYNIKKYFKSIF